MREFRLRDGDTVRVEGETLVFRAGPRKPAAEYGWEISNLRRLYFSERLRSFGITVHDGDHGWPLDGFASRDDRDTLAILLIAVNPLLGRGHEDLLAIASDLRPPAPAATPVPTAAGPERRALVCGHCGAPVERSARACPYCHVLLA